MAQQHLEPTDPLAGHAGRITGDALAAYLRSQATEFLRALRQHRESGGASAAGAEDPVDAARALRRSVRRISASLHTFRPLLDPGWSESLRPELAWLSGTLGMEHAYESRLERLLLALHRLSGAVFPTQSASAAVGTAGSSTHPVSATDRGNLTVGAAKAGALLDRQLTLARTRAHSTALQALGSSRFHAVADNIAVLASEVPLTKTAVTTDLHPMATAAQERLEDAVTVLPLVTAGHPYNAEALIHGLSPDPSPTPRTPPGTRSDSSFACTDTRGRSSAAPTPGGATAPDGRSVPGPSPGRLGGRGRRRSGGPHPRIAPATAYALGVLHADQRHEVEAARFAFQQCWQKQAVST